MWKIDQDLLGCWLVGHVVGTIEAGPHGEAHPVPGAALVQVAIADVPPLAIAGRAEFEDRPLVPAGGTRADGDARTLDPGW